MSLFRVGRERFGAVENALCVTAGLVLGKAVGAVFGVMCDPRIRVGGAPPFVGTFVYGVPVWAAVFFGMAFMFVVVDRRLPRLSRILQRYRLAISVGCLALAVVLPMLPFPHGVLGACRS